MHFDYILPRLLIAQRPVSPRDSSRLLIVSKKIQHKHFYNIIDYLNKEDVLVLNQTKVIPAKLIGKKQTGTKVELIIEEISKTKCKCLLKTKNPKPGNILLFQKYRAEILNQDRDYFTVEFNEDTGKIMKEIGILPLPPYIKEKLEKNTQYQTIYSKDKGSIAAPTAGLHFTKRLLNQIKRKGVKIAVITLHIDFGTFLPVRDIKTHKMHKEYFKIDKKNADIINNREGRLFVTGTTSVRALESANKNNKIQPIRSTTELFIKPGYRFKTKIDGMITNFHLPNSTLLMLVSAFAGRKRILNAYKIAVKEKYRFFSFGDAMLILK